MSASPDASASSRTEPTVPKAGRRERERLARRAEILASARSVFAERGFTRATLDEIATRAEFGKGTLYNYFPDGKDEILFAVIDDIYGDLAALVGDAFPAAAAADWKGNARIWFSDFIQSCFQYFEANRELFLILTKEASRMCFSDQDNREDYFRQHRQHLTGILAQPVRNAIRARAMRPFPPDAVADMLFGNIHGLQMHRALPGGGHATVEESASFLSSFLFDGLLLDQGESP